MIFTDGYLALGVDPGSSHSITNKNFNGVVNTSNTTSSNGTTNGNSGSNNGTTQSSGSSNGTSNGKK